MDLQSLIKSGGANGKVELPPGEFFGQVIIDRPITVSGIGKASWIGSLTSPVIRIVSKGVKLKNLMVEVTTNAGNVAIEAEFGTNPVLENVVVRGLIVGVPSQNITSQAVDNKRLPTPPSFASHPPIRSPEAAAVTQFSPIPAATQQHTPPSPIPVQLPVSPTISDPVIESQTPWGVITAILLIVLILASGAIYYVFHEAERERARAAARVKEVQRIAAIEKEQLEKEKLAKEQEIEKVKQEKDQEIERQRTIWRENQDREILQEIGNGQARRVRDIVRRQVESIARFVVKGKAQMTTNHGAISGNVRRGNAAWSVRTSHEEATKGALAGCEKNGTACEELFTMTINNGTGQTLTIYVYHPWETNFDKSSYLWSWTLKPGVETNLVLTGAGPLLVSKRFYLHGKCSDGTDWGGAKRIADYDRDPGAFSERSFPDGGNIRVRFSNSP